ncbi:tetratricopeptide repeat protein [Roseivirga sp.]|uniref:tetratricopeptide repeat protein n=1 Tax=Roseivirga sp. TaxID=1964215 RepID=UPI003B8DAAB4
MIKKYGSLVLILVIALVVYFPVTNGEYLAGWDDDQQILNNTDVTNLSWESIKNYFTTYYVASYQPLASLSFGIEYAIFGENAFVHHLTNVLLHLLNVFLVFLLLKRLFKDNTFLVLFVTAVFAIHPLQTEVVGWISTRSTLMYCVFFFMSCLFYIKYLEQPSRKLKHLLICVLFFVLALLTKATAVTLPLILLLLDYFYKRTFTWRMLIEKVPLFIGSIIIGLASIDSRKVLDSIGGFSDYYTFFEKVALSSYSLMFYFWKAVSPGNLYTYYGYPMKIQEETLGTLYWLAPFGLLLVMAILWLVYRKSSSEFKRFWLFGILFFAVNIGLVINFTPFGPTMAAERYMYMPLIGIYVCFALVLSQLLTSSQGKNVAYILASLALLIFSVKSRVQSTIWESRVSLWENAIEHTNAAYPWMELGNEYQGKGNIDKAIEYYNGGVEVNPYYTKIYYYRGLAIKASGDKDYAKIDFERVIKGGNDKKGDAFYERGLLYEEANMLDSALLDYDSAMVYSPESPAMFRKSTLAGNNNSVGSQTVLMKRLSQMMIKADSLMKVGALDQALENFENVLLINPQMEAALMSKGLILSNNQAFAESIEAFSKILDTDPDQERARLSRAFAYTQTKDFIKSIEDYNHVVNEIGTRTGEVLYFRAIALLNANQKSAACKDLAASQEKGYSAATKLMLDVCK